MRWVLELDIRSYFDKIVRATLVEMIEKRVTDGSVLRLIGKWIKVEVIEDGKLLVSETGTGQGQPISPLLANIYLHYVLDEWFEEVVKPRLKGEAYEIRFATFSEKVAQLILELNVAAANRREQLIRELVRWRP
jgi:retron-type reverse transcriptase